MRIKKYSGKKYFSVQVLYSEDVNNHIDNNSRLVYKNNKPPFETLIVKKILIIIICPQRIEVGPSLHPVIRS